MHLAFNETSTFLVLSRSHSYHNKSSSIIYATVISLTNLQYHWYNVLKLPILVYNLKAQDWISFIFHDISSKLVM